MKDVVGYETLYEINEDGLIFVKSTGECIPWRFRSVSKTYLEPVVDLFKDGKKKQFRLAFIVADAYLGKSRPQNVVYHMDKNPLNNNYKNLRWCTRAEHQTYHNLGDKADEYFDSLEME